MPTARICYNDVQGSFSLDGNLDLKQAGGGPVRKAQV